MKKLLLTALLSAALFAGPAAFAHDYGLDTNVSAPEYVLSVSMPDTDPMTFKATMLPVVISRDAFIDSVLYTYADTVSAYKLAIFTVADCGDDDIPDPVFKIPLSI